MKVGSTDVWDRRREYAVPAGVLREGRNVIAVRLIDIDSEGGWFDSSPTLEFPGASGLPAVALGSNWLFQTGASLTDTLSFPVARPFDQQSPGVLHRSMIAPLQPFPIAGVIWYQGESNQNQAASYPDLFTGLMSSWRKEWGSKEWPFLYVQVAPYKDMRPEIREAQRLTLAKTSHTAMVVTTDIGDAGDIHPAAKEPVGLRLALAARALVYGEPIEYSGPLVEAATLQGEQVTVRFSHYGAGLEARGGDLRGFELVAADGRVAPARAAMTRDLVLLSCPDVPQPVAVRYGWANVPDVNLFNRNGLPASPFQLPLSAKHP